MLKALFVFILEFGLLVPSVAMIAQDAPAKHFTMRQIVFKGTRVLKDEELLKALDMKIGGSYTQQDLLDGANKLSNSGMFSQVSYRFGPDSAEFNLTDNPHLLPVHFENCVWMTEDEVIAALKQRVPLFVGELPEQGMLADELGNKLEVVLAEKGVKAKVQYVPFVEDGSATAMNYTIIDPRIEVSAVRFSGASPEIAKALDDAVKKILRKEYTRTLLPRAEDEILKPILATKGYLKARFGQPALRLVSAAVAPDADVELTVPVEEGAQYRIGSIAIKGHDAIAMEDSKRLAAFKTGDVANMTKVRAELAKLGGAYVASGHLGAKVRAEPTFDEAAHTVSFEIELLPGEVYKLSKLDMQGLDEALKAKVSPIWKLNPGDVYDPNYAPTFLSKNASKLVFLNGYSLAWTQKVYDQTKSVELFLFFRKPGSGGQ